MKNMNNTVFLVFLLLFLIDKSLGLKCYTCSLTEDDSDTSCADKPQSMKNGVTDCDKKYCIIVRMDYKDPRGKLSSMVRNCVDKPLYVNKIIEDDKYRTYYKACRSDLCNTGNGRTDTTDMEVGSLGDKSTIYCPGINKDGAFSIQASVVIVFVLTSMSFILM